MAVASMKIGFDLFEFGIIKRRQLVGVRIGRRLASRAPIDISCHPAGRFPGQHRFQIRVPVDDVTTMHYWYSCYLPPTGKRAPAQEFVPLYECPGGMSRGISGWISSMAGTSWPGSAREPSPTAAGNAGEFRPRDRIAQEITVGPARAAQRGEDPMGSSATRNRTAASVSPRSTTNWGQRPFLRRAMDISHARFSPIREQVLAMLTD